MGYFTPGISGGGDGHTHPNKAVLDQITDPGNGQIITDEERTAIGRYVGGEGDADNWAGTVPVTTDEAIARIARVLKEHMGIAIPEPPESP